MQLSASPLARSRGVTWLAALLIASPLVQWAYVSALSYLTILEPPFTGSRGIPLAMQLFFAPGNIIAIVLGVGLALRSEWTRRIARVVCVIAAGLSAWVVAVQFATAHLDSNLLLAGLSFALTLLYSWYFGRDSVRVEFSARQGPTIKMESAPAKASAPYSRALIVAACVEIMLGLAAGLLVWYLYTGFGARPLLDVGPGIGVTEADELLRKFLSVAFALFLAPHALTMYASIGIMIGRDTTATARRHALIACWTTIGAALVTAWLATREGLAFDPRTVRFLLAFCGVSLTWHACFLYILARYRSTQ
jgi:hypothetical protein